MQAAPRPEEIDPMGLMQILWAIVVGFVVGLVARAVLPGADRLGFWLTAAVGVAGSWIGGYLGSLISKPAEGAMFHPAGFLMSVVGAVVLLLVVRAVRGAGV